MSAHRPAISVDRFAPLEERREFGRSRRNQLRRVDQAVWKPDLRRPDPISSLIQANRGRRQDLLPLKWGRMKDSPFGFFRGAAALMAYDLAAGPSTGLFVQICGDAHIVNLGAFAAPDGHLVFDLNDFDETSPGPWEWDIKRLAASIILAGREAGDGKTNCAIAVQAFVESYRESMKSFSEMKVLELVRWQIRRHSIGEPVRLILEKAERGTSRANLKKLTIFSIERAPQFHDRLPQLRHVPQKVADSVVSSLASYRNTISAGHQLAFRAYRPVDVAFKVAGTGSVGVRNYAVLLLGAIPDDALFLQIKEALPSCYVPYVRDVPRFSHQGRRVAEGQHCMQTVSDPFVGWTTIDKADCHVRQLADHKAAITISDLRGTALIEYGMVCGEVLGKAHARTGDPATIAGYCGDSPKLDQALAQFAATYADQTEQDHALFKKAIKSGRINATDGTEAA